MSQPDATTRPAAAPDYSQARGHMVDSQIRPVQVNDPRILRAMRTLPRERFVPAESASLAYADRAIRLREGRVLMEPRILARMLQVLVPRAGESALVVGAATGYSAALLAALGLRVTALEQDPALAAEGERLCAEFAPAVRFQLGPLRAGWPAGAPYDLIIIDGAVRALPEAFGAQLAAAGRLAAVLWPEGRCGTAVLAEASTHGLRARPQFDASSALIPELAPAARFNF